MKFICLLVLVVAVTVKNGASDRTPPVNCPAWNLPGIRVQIAHPERCDLYYKCLFGLPHLRSCEMGQHFNPDLQICDLSENVNCDNKTTTPSTPTSSPTTLSPSTSSTPTPTPHCPDRGTLKIWDGKYCNGYYMCMNGQISRRLCCSKGHFDKEKRNCVDTGSEQCKPWLPCANM